MSVPLVCRPGVIARVAALAPQGDLAWPAAMSPMLYKASLLSS
jgi:hypothetical protein